MTVQLEQRMAEVAAALAAAGVSPSVLPDALAVFRSLARLNPDGTWYLSTGSSTLLAGGTEKAVKNFLASRKHFTGGEPVGAQADDHWPRGADGKRLAIADLTQEELWELAGEWPGKEKPKLAPVYASDFEQHATIEAVNANDTSEQRTKDLRQAVQSDRRYTPAELSKMDNEELWLAAGPFPK